MVRCHESDRGKNLLLFEKCEGQLMILREEMKRFVNYPRGSVVTKATRREYRSKTKGIRKYANFYDNIDIDGKQLHVSKRAKRWRKEELREKYGEYDPNDYRIKENLPEIRDKLRYKKYVEESVETLEKQVKEVRERLNFGKRRKEKEITREEAEMLGMRYGAGEKIAKGWREKKQRKTLIARYGTKKELEKEFGSAGEMSFYLCDGKVMETRRGESMRSRAELLVAEVLNALGIPYIYEYYVREAEASCDFLVYIGGRKYYLEVLGMMDRKEYRERWEEKLESYRTQGIEMGKNLIVLDLTEREYLDLVWIEEMLSRVAEGKVPSSVIYGVKNLKKAKSLKGRVTRKYGEIEEPRDK